jgi:hypothetical protein
MGVQFGAENAINGQQLQRHAFECIAFGLAYRHVDNGVGMFEYQADALHIVASYALAL